MTIISLVMEWKLLHRSESSREILRSSSLWSFSTSRCGYNPLTSTTSSSSFGERKIVWNILILESVAERNNMIINSITNCLAHCRSEMGTKVADEKKSLCALSAPDRTIFLSIYEYERKKSTPRHPVTQAGRLQSPPLQPKLIFPTTKQWSSILFQPVCGTPTSTSSSSCFLSEHFEAFSVRIAAMEKSDFILETRIWSCWKKE